MTQEQAQALAAARGLAKRDGWSTALLGAVEYAINEADPFGPDFLAEPGDWWEAIGEKLAETAAARPRDAEKLSQLFVIAQSGAVIQGPMDAIMNAPADFMGGVAADVRGAVAAVPEVLDTGAQIARLAVPVAVLGFAWYWLRGRG